MAATRWRQMRRQLAQPWLRAVLYVTLIPLFPEYVAPVLAVLSLAAAGREAKASRRPVTVGSAGKALLLYVAYLALTVPFAALPLQSLESVLLWGMMLCPVLALTTLLTDRSRMETALYLLTLTAGLVGLVGCVQYFLRQIGLNTPLQLWEPLDRWVYGILPFGVDIRVSGLRVSATFSNPNILGQYLVLVTPFAAHYACNVAKGQRRTVARFSLLTVVGCAAFTFSRGTYLAMLVIAAIMIFTNMRSLFTVILTVLSAILLVPDAVWNRLMTVGKLDVSTLERLKVWQITVDLIVRRPLIGFGCGVQYVWSVMLANGIRAPHAHNLVLQVLAEGGIIGLILLLFLGFRVIQTAFALTSRKECRRVGGALLAFFAGFAVSTTVEYGFTFPKVMGAFVLAVALIDGYANLLLARAPSPLAEAATLSGRLSLHRSAGNGSGS